LASAARSSNVISHQQKWADSGNPQRGVVVVSPLHLPSRLTDCILAIKITFWPDGAVVGGGVVFRGSWLGLLVAIDKPEIGGNSKKSNDQWI